MGMCGISDSQVSAYGHFNVRQEFVWVCCGISDSQVSAYGHFNVPQEFVWVCVGSVT